jgi:hypothetical protein
MKSNMLEDRLWSVEIGQGMGPFLLGLPRSEVTAIVRLLGFKIDSTLAENDAKLYIEEMDSTLVFSAQSPQTLERIDVCDWRIRFGSLDVYNTPIHELVLLLKVSPTETLWCDREEFDRQREHAEQVQDEQVQAENETDQDLIQSGTLWFTTLGLGVSLDRGTVEEVHVCDPELSPRFGTGCWTEAQRVLSIEVQRVSQSGGAVRLNKKKHPLVTLWFVGLLVAFGGVIWRSFELQKRWSNAPNVFATVIAVDPPPPEMFPHDFTLSYLDSSGHNHEVQFNGHDYSGHIKVGDEIAVRFMPEAPDKPIGPNHFSDRGLDYALPCIIAIGLVYAFSHLLLMLVPAMLHCGKPSARPLACLNPRSGRRTDHHTTQPDANLGGPWHTAWAVFDPKEGTEWFATFKPHQQQELMGILLGVRAGDSIEPFPPEDQLRLICECYSRYWWWESLRTDSRRPAEICDCSCHTGACIHRQPCCFGCGSCGLPVRREHEAAHQPKCGKYPGPLPGPKSKPSPIRLG